MHVYSSDSYCPFQTEKVTSFPSVLLWLSYLNFAFTPSSMLMCSITSLVKYCQIILLSLPKSTLEQNVPIYPRMALPYMNCFTLCSISNAFKAHFYVCRYEYQMSYFWLFKFGHLWISSIIMFQCSDCIDYDAIFLSMPL